jgi:hypothetical protein
MAHSSPLQARPKKNNGALSRSEIGSLPSLQELAPAVGNRLNAGSYFIRGNRDCIVECDCKRKPNKAHRPCENNERYEEEERDGTRGRWRWGGGAIV